MKKHGIDVSKWQGKIDWDRVKKSGKVDFAILRIGYGFDTKDEQFERNAKECERVGIPWGGYLYSYALNVGEAKKEADFTLACLKGKNPTMPIYFDMEDADGYKKKNGMPSNANLVNMCEAFLKKIEAAGYYAGLYASRSWLNNQLKSDKLDKYDKWLAEWASKPTYKGTFNLWQYSDSGKIDGIDGHVDVNYAYQDLDVFNVSKKKPSKHVSKSPAKPKQNVINYRVKAGDTLSEIAVKHKVSLSDLLKANPKIKNRDIIFIGQTIKIIK